jgi:endo-1,4-beta-mannosidase
VAARELDLIQAAGLNTIRIFLWYPALFDCPGSGLVPRAEAFARLDGILALAAARDLHVLVTLNDLPDLSIRPLYTNPTIAAAYTAYIVDRYRAEPTILAWDLRNEGDIDITREQQSPAAVYRWLEETSKLVRATDPNHLITAGWLSNPISTDPAVDFFSFHHWTEATAIFDRVRALRALSTKPVLLEEVGYSTFGGDRERQSRDLLAAVQAADQAGMLGWIVWTAFDFPTAVTCIQPACPSKDNGEHHFGLWRVGYSAKPAVEALLRYTATNK